MRLAILFDFVGEGFQPPIFGLADRAAILLDDGLELFLQRVRLLRRDILASKEHMFVKRHGMRLSVLPELMLRREAPFEPCRKGPRRKTRKSGNTGRIRT